MAYAITDFGRKAFTYTTDQPSIPKLTVRLRRVDEVAVGQAVEDLGLAGRPPFWKLRHILIVSGPDQNNIIHHRKIIICAPNNPFFTGATVQINNLDGLTWTVKGRIGEARRTGGRG